MLHSILALFLSFFRGLVKDYAAVSSMLDGSERLIQAKANRRVTRLILLYPFVPPHRYSRLANLRWPFPSSKVVQEATSCTFRSEEGRESIHEFAGNFVLFVGLLLFIFFVHVAVASGIETYMILKRRAFDEIRASYDRGVDVRYLSSTVLSTSGGKRSALSAASRDIEDNGKKSSFECEQGENDIPVHSRISDELNECRDKSKSVWLHFPHLELVFLFFAFQGAVMSETKAIRYTGLNCPSVFFTAMLGLVRHLN